jgi:hypothetical protein
MNAIMYQRIIASGCHSSHSVLVVVVHGEIVSDKGKKREKTILYYKASINNSNISRDYYSSSSRSDAIRNNNKG